MQIFVSTTFLGPDRTRVTDVVEALKGAPFDGLELGSTHLAEDEKLLLDIPKIWGGRLLTHNFFPPMADESFVLNLAAADLTNRAQSLAHYRYCLGIAARLGAEVYTVHPGFMAAPVKAASSKGESYYDFEFAKDTVPHETAFAAMLDGLTVLLNDARKHGVTLAIETEGSVTRQGILLMEQPHEYDRLFAALPGIKLNFNLAHSSLSAKVHGFSLDDFIARFGPHFAAVEISHNDGHSDQHAPLTADSYVLSWAGKLPDVPWILEFRNASVNDLLNSAALLHNTKENRHAIG